MAAPYRANPVVPGQCRVGVECYIGHAEVVADKRLHQTQKGEEYKQALGHGRWLRKAHGQRVTPPGAIQRDRCLQQRQT